MADVFYRYVRAHVATLDDFRANGALGKRMKRPGNQRAWNDGVSVWGTFDAACQRALLLAFSPGSYVVRIELSDEHGLAIEGPSGWGGQHYTIYDVDPQYLMDCAGAPAKMPGAL